MRVGRWLLVLVPLVLLGLERPPVLPHAPAPDPRALVPRVVPIPPDNPQTPAKVELGRRLFYDPRLSLDGKVACASCHRPEFAFSDGGNPVSVGVFGREGTRNAPTLTNVAFRRRLFWEGRSPRLELQAVGPLTAHHEMGMEPEALARRLSSIPEYARAFQEVFGEPPSLKNVAFALAAFERTLLSYNSPFDRFVAGDDRALSPAALRGMELFFSERGDCFHCHVGPEFTDDEPRNTGLYTVYPDVGLARITGRDEDVGKFKTPTLRNVALTAPYMHDGSKKTLREVMEHYNRGGEPNLNADPLIRPLGLSESEVDDLVAFLESLTDAQFISNPALLPSR
ncbi:Cytochrome c551 peroxidase [Meiothermus luteus]|uniref:Cytochrome c551 peroxidase n=1 Tax=Meiothermus luteus TaxID=2026184 RepID=A0A399ER46_9DEIN|nr:cytochrome c peroxidase [Meiothermus luteus]RIH86033.1 Cytochrome c551 peroxidase [Meiothermus luteus]RMH55268.1 MAG: methylamine utilization protein [Deinococcota bacterium]